MYKDLKNSELNSLKIKTIAEKNNILFIDRKKIFCNTIKKICPSVTKDGYKIYWDKAHITDKGADFFAKIIEKDELLSKYFNSFLLTSSN